MTTPSPAPRFQFSLRWLLISVAIVAGLLALAAIPVGQLLLGTLLVVARRGLLPTVAVVGAIYGRGDLRAFSIGAIVASIPVLTAGLNSTSLVALAVGTIWQLMTMALCGVVAVATRRWLDRHGLTREK